MQPLLQSPNRIGFLVTTSAALLLFVAFFLPWIEFEANGRSLITLSGLQATSLPVTSSRTDLFRPSFVPYLAPICALLVLLTAFVSWLRRFVTGWDAALFIGLGFLGIFVLWIGFVNARELASEGGVSLQSQVGAWLAILSLFAVAFIGLTNLRNVTHRRPELRSQLNALSFMAPATFLVLVFFVIPVLILVLLSLTDLSSSNFSEPWRYVGLENYQRLFRDSFFPKILGNTFRYVLLTLGFFNVGLALLLALLTTHINRRAGFFFRMLWLLPRITPSVVYIVMWQRIAQQPPHGIVNLFLSLFGAEIPGSLIAEFPWLFVVMVNGFVGASFGMIIFTSAIESIPVDLTRAAKVDGASTLQVIRDITLPLLRWPLLFVVTYQTLSLLVSFEYILLLTNGGPGLYTTEVWALTAYKRALGTYFGSNQWAYGAAWGFILVAIGITLSAVYMRVFRFDDLMQEPKIDVV